MTNGYFVIEEKGKIKKAVYLMSDSYLDNGYGEKMYRNLQMRPISGHLQKNRN